MTVSIHSLDIGYNEVLLKNLSLELKNNYIYCISASNGAGKTCLARTLTKFIPPVSTNKSIDSYKHYSIDFVSAESSGLIEEYTGRANLGFYAGSNLSLVLNVFGDIPIILKILELEVCYYSSGMRQILKLLISLSSKKETLIWDEPFKSIAPDIQKMISNRMLLNRDSLLLNRSLLILDHVNHQWEGNHIKKMKIKDRELIDDL